MAKEKISAEEREQKRIEKWIAYKNGHFFITWQDSDKNGKPIDKHDVIGGRFDEQLKAVIFTLDSYSNYVAVDNHMGGLFIYRCCKTSTKSCHYSRYAQYSKILEKENKGYLVEIVGDITNIDDLLAKAKVAKGFKEMNDRQLEAARVAKKRSEQVYQHTLKKAQKNVEQVAV